MQRPHAPRRPSRFQRGVTLIETTVATAVFAIAAGAVAPGLATLRSHQAVASAAAEFETDVAHVRSLAVTTGTTWRITFEAAQGRSCYVIHSGAAGDCPCLDSPQPVCADGMPAMKRAAYGLPDHAVALTSNVGSMAFDGIKGTSTPAGTVRLVARDGSAVHQVVNVMGRVRSCSPNRSIGSYKAC